MYMYTYIYLHTYIHTYTNTYVLALTCISRNFVHDLNANPKAPSDMDLNMSHVWTYDV